MPQTLEELLDRLQPLLEERWTHAALIVIGSFIAARLADLAISQVVRRLARKTRTDLDDRIVAVLHKPIFWSVVLLGISSLPEVLEPPELVGRIYHQLLQTIGVSLWAVVTLRLVRIVLERGRGYGRTGGLVNDATTTLFRNLANVVVYGGAVYLLLETWNVPVGPWIASAGIVGIAVGFAAKDTLANLFAGVFILIDKPYSIGDFVNLADGERGMVTEIGLRSTRLLTRDDIEVTVPNSIIGQETIVNETGGPSTRSRIRLKVGVAYGSDIDRVQDTLLTVATTHEDLCPEPEPRVRFRAFGDSSLDFELLGWIREPVDRGRVLHELHCEVYRRFAENEIEIPFPQRDVHLKGGSPG